MKSKIKVHPGEILNEEVIKQRNLTIHEAACKLDITIPKLKSIIDGLVDIDQELAYKIANAFGGTPDIWIRLQNNYNN